MLKVPISISGKLQLMTGQQLPATLMVHTDGSCRFVGSRGECFYLKHLQRFDVNQPTGSPRGTEQ